MPNTRAFACNNGQNISISSSNNSLGAIASSSSPPVTMMMSSSSSSSSGKANMKDDCSNAPASNVKKMSPMHQQQQQAAAAAASTKLRSCIQSNCAQSKKLSCHISSTSLLTQNNHQTPTRNHNNCKENLAQTATNQSLNHQRELSVLKSREKLHLAQRSDYYNNKQKRTPGATKIHGGSICQMSCCCSASIGKADSSNKLSTINCECPAAAAATTSTLQAKVTAAAAAATVAKPQGVCCCPAEARDRFQQQREKSEYSGQSDQVISPTSSAAAAAASTCCGAFTEKQKKKQQQLSKSAKDSPADECAKCQLLIRWTQSQTKLMHDQQQRQQQQQQRLVSTKTNNTNTAESRCGQQQLTNGGNSSRLKFSSNGCNKNINDDDDDCDYDDNIAELSSLTSEEDDRTVSGSYSADNSDKYSNNRNNTKQELGSMEDENSSLTISQTKANNNMTSQALASKSASDHSKPLTTDNDTHRNSSQHSNKTVVQKRLQQQTIMPEPKCPEQQLKHKSAKIPSKVIESVPVDDDDDDKEQPDAKLLDEHEVNAIELFLKSHKSSVYVCGCMANLYFTRTHLSDNGRISKPEQNGWRLNKTGIPVLIFDSGLAKNRQRKRLSISLAERGSGFILWSDTIDHLSNYRAFDSRQHGNAASDDLAATSSKLTKTKATATTQGDNNDPMQPTTCDSFHVMYLSSNHRIMVGLSFDDLTCARLFLAQIDLVCSDPANIALSGPKQINSYSSSQEIKRVTNAKQRALMMQKNITKQQQQESRLSLNNCSSNEHNEIILQHQQQQQQQKQRQMQFMHQHRKAFGMSKLLTSFRYATRRPLCGQVMSAKNHHHHHHQRSSPKQCQNYHHHNSGWSTLKRAMRLGRSGTSECKNGISEALRDDLFHSSIVGCDPNGRLDERTSRLVAAFKPKPLAQLAAAGQVWRKKASLHESSSKTRACLLPRKSDISAPCLFQHITSVDSTTLDSLYSKSFVAETIPPPPPKVECFGRPNNRASTSKTLTNSISSGQESMAASPSLEAVAPAATSHTSSSEQHQHYRPSNCTVYNFEQRQKQTQISAVDESGSDGKENSNLKKVSSKIKSSSLSSSSSCYSSASISPASSECSAVLLAKQQMRLMNGKRLLVNGSKQIILQQRRPPIPPPDPPIRRITHRNTEHSEQSDGCQSEDAADYDRNLNHHRPAISGDPRKIGSIIRELQSKKSSTLVDAKRKLMAELIADQVKLVNRQKQELSRVHDKPNIKPIAQTAQEKNNRVSRL